MFLQLIVLVTLGSEVVNFPFLYLFYLVLSPKLTLGIFLETQQRSSLSNFPEYNRGLKVSKFLMSLGELKNLTIVKKIKVLIH